MGNQERNFFVFCIALLGSLIFWRLYVYFFYLECEKISYFRHITGLTIHHYHYGLLIILLATLYLIFLKRDYISVALMGIGLGTVFDSFISRLFKSFSRGDELL